MKELRKGSSIATVLPKIGRILAHQYDLRVIYGGTRCETDGKTIRLPALPEAIPEELFRVIRGWLDHECAHARFTTVSRGAPFLKKHGEPAFALLNTLEDIRVDRCMGEVYPGTRLNLDVAYRCALEEKAKISMSLFTQFIFALFFKALGYPDQPFIEPSLYRLVDMCKEELEELPACRQTVDVEPLALRVWDKIRAAQTEEETEEKTEEQDASQQKKAAEEDHPQEKGAEAGEKPAASEQLLEELHSLNAARSASGEREAGQFPPMDNLPELIQVAVARAQEDIPAYRPYTTEYDKVVVPEKKAGFDYQQEIAALMPYVRGLRQRLLRTLMGAKATRRIGETTRGSLDPRTLHRLLTASTNRIFRKTVEVQAKNTACTLLLDLSLSMEGERIGLCKDLALIFAETLSVLDFPTEIIGFSTLGDSLLEATANETGLSVFELSEQFARFEPLLHVIYKDFSETWRGAASRFSSFRTRSLTPLGEALLFSGARLARRSETRKVLFCLTDGHPQVDGKDTTATTEKHACDVVKKLTRAGIEPVGIGICDSAVAGIFPRYVVVRKLSELSADFFQEVYAVLARKWRARK